MAIRYRNGAYVVTVHIGRDLATDKERRVSRSVRMPEQKRTPREVLELEARLRNEVAAGHHASPHLTVGELLDHWVAHIDGRLSPTTLVGYRQAIRLYIKPHLGAVKLAKLKPARVDAFYRKLTAQGLAPATVRQAHSILRRSIHSAVRWGWVATNAAAFAEPPPLVHRERVIPAQDEIAKLIADAEPDLADLISLAASTGARRGELCGLRWSDVDGRDLVIGRAVLDVRHSLHEKLPKSGRGRRIVIGPKLADRLQNRRERMEARAERFATTLVADPYILSDDIRGAKPLHPTLASDRFRRIARRHGLTVSLHDLRHAAVTRALASGVPVRDVAHHVGHASAKMTLDVYAHAVPGAAERIAELLDY